MKDLGSKTKRNSLTVRVIDHDYNKFLEAAGKTYSLTLRALINAYSANFLPEDLKLPMDQRIKVVMQRMANKEEGWK
jgi:hypothetical protein